MFTFQPIVKWKSRNHFNIFNIIFSSRQRQGESYVVCYLGAGPSPCCPPAQACTCGIEPLGANKAQLVNCKLLNSMAAQVYALDLISFLFLTYLRYYVTISI